MDEFDTTPTTAFASGNAASNYENLTTSIVSSQPSTSAQAEPKPIQKDVFCCAVDRLLSQHNEKKRCPSGPLQVISIVDAYKNTDGTGNHYLYQIAFKKCFGIISSIFDVFLASYAKPSKSKIDLAISEKRKRMLQTFLNRLVEHPVLCSHHLFHRFLEEDKNWNDIMASENVKKDKTASSSSKLKNPDPKFMEIENDNSYYSHSLNSLDKTQKRISRKCQDYSDLGASFNGFSLEEKNLSSALEKIGEGIDGIHLTTNNLGAYFEECFGESLHEYALYSQSVKNVLRYRRAKQLELESIQEEHFTKQNQLLQLEGAVASRKNSVVTSLTNHLSNMLDTSPEMSRKHGISKTKDIITQKQKVADELSSISKLVNDELERFHAVRQRDLKHIIKSYVQEQINYYKSVTFIYYFK
ncbi:hypothetical protein ROZALSC1DRAFT_31417 [Rozella allomycis CSF55]|uniref:PX domain-containing protein n=1 Tax=Rozella allomycis (strain CSF55) TaxID=988480 RepID=A0A075ANE5_ROZAC|nr:hypothetical protein O9G_005983 [Rozella allomycis CSF55]RKP16709.1 hypothetical protein ROZALSC1DRAFT_31417 [Rozella allomycis CSF55]|eukprot:EPZ31375.1 hypothetical protein O9G_005983 [Rozella allomycis CSF55]